MASQALIREKYELALKRIRDFHLRKIGDNENYFCITETFIFDTKRGARIYPAKYSREGTQRLCIVNQNQEILSKIEYEKVKEDTLSRKTLIYRYVCSFLKLQGLKNKDYECFLLADVEKE